jgi:hypothetical protein
MQSIKVFLILVILISISKIVWSQPECESVEGVNFICGPVNAEDLILVPNTDWIVASAMAPDTAFYLINAISGAWSAPEIHVDHDIVAYPLCPSAPVMGSLETHGLNIRGGSGNQSTLYSVVHGARESIEVFAVDASGDSPVLTWKGCVLMPEGLAANSVASFADGSLVATILLMPGKTFADSIAMRPTGAVVKWSPGESGFTLIENSELPGNKGIEVSADGNEIYVVSSGFQTIVAFSNTNPARQLRTTQQLPITPDNVHRGLNGMLLTGGMKNDVPECGGAPSPQHDLGRLATCPRGSIAIEVDPATMQNQVLVETPAIPSFSNATMVLITGSKYWLGTFSGDRIAYGMLP